MTDLDALEKTANEVQERRRLPINQFGYVVMEPRDVLRLVAVARAANLYLRDLVGVSEVRDALAALKEPTK